MPQSYGILVAVQSYFFTRILLKLFVSQGLIQAETAVSRKASTWGKDNKDYDKIKLE